MDILKEPIFTGWFIPFSAFSHQASIRAPGRKKVNIRHEVKLIDE
jgi:hypothetical protein